MVTASSLGKLDTVLVSSSTGQAARVMSTTTEQGHLGLRSSSRQKQQHKHQQAMSASSYVDVKNPSTVDHDGFGEHEALLCRDFAMSSAQQAYQRDASRQDLSDSEIIFYKDATPKAEHYMAFRVDLPPSVARTVGPSADIPLEVELVAIMPQPVGAAAVPPITTEPRQYETVPDQSHLKQCGVRPSASQPPSDRPLVGMTLAYRIELGSYRQGDRRFAILVRIAAKAAADSPALRSVAPCLTPPVYVASKVKRHRVSAADHYHDNQSSAKRHETELARTPAPTAAASRHETDPAILALKERCENLERLICRKVLPALARIEGRLMGAPPLSSVPSTDIAPDSNDTIFAGVPSLTLERGNSEQIINSFYAPDYSIQPSADEIGGFWADSMTTMGNGLQEAMTASGLVPSPPTSQAQAPAAPFGATS